MTSLNQIEEKGLTQVDFVMVTGDAYVDHPSFGSSLIARYLESFGYSVAILSQPRINDPLSITKCGQPRLGFLVTSGNMDSMVNHYYASKKRRKRDEYTVNGLTKRRPDYAVNEYCKLIRRTYHDIPIIIGGIEASLRRFSHYDVWQDKVLPSILLSSSADLCVYSMGEKAIIEIADYLNSGLNIKDITFINGTSYFSRDLNHLSDYELLDSYEISSTDKISYAKNFMKAYHNNENQKAKIVVEPYNEGYVIQNIPQTVLNTQELDHIYDLPFTYESYDEIHGLGKVNALSEIKFSIQANRGCNGGCSFCAITMHQGKQISMRSVESVVLEAKKLRELKDFKGYIHDLGGPTANFNDEMCDKLQNQGSCNHRECYAPKICPNIKFDHSKYLAMLREVRNLDGIKKVFIRSGIRFDYLLYDKDNSCLEDIVKYHVSGQLRLAPEHSSNNVLKLMNKPQINVYERFVDKFDALSKKHNLNQYTVPYLISNHPGSTLDDALNLAIFLKKINYRPLQVQDYYPTPGTMATTMFYTKLDPRTLKPIYVCYDEHEKAMQRALLQVHKPENYDLVNEALKKLKRLDLIGFKQDSLLRPKRVENKYYKK